MNKNNLILSLGVLAGGLFSSGVAVGHGSMEVPLSRAFQCYKEGPESLQSDACKEAARIGGVQAVYDWNAISQNAAGNDKGFVPDGMLCSGGNVKYRGFDAARTDWKKTVISADDNGEFQFVFRGTAPHATKRWDFYITKDEYDPTKALTWDDLEPAPFCQRGSVPLSDGRYYIDCPLPADKSGDHVIYNIWERSDSPETFYSCVDVTISNGGTSGGEGDIDETDDGSNGDHNHGDHGGDHGGSDNTGDNTNDSGSDGNHDDGHHDDAGDSGSDHGSHDCGAPAFASGTTYRAGDLVANNGEAFECVIGGWCSSTADWAYAPGTGLYWSEAWKKADQCSVDHGGSDSDSNSDSGSDNGNDQTGCDAPAFHSGSQYQAGDVVANAGANYQCTIPGWCQSTADWAYAPGKGLFWEHAWTLTQECGGSSTDSDSGSHGDHSGDHGSDDNSGSDGDDSNTDSNNDSGNDSDASDDSSSDGHDSGSDTSDDSNDDSTDNGQSGNGDNQDGGQDSNQDSNNNGGNVGDSKHVVASYFVEWGVYGRNYHVMDMPGDQLTHVIYAFLPVCGPNDSLRQANPTGYSVLLQQCAGKKDYEVVIHDKFAALEKSYPGDRWDDPIRGNFGQMIKFKQAHPHVKILPSVGGWTLSDPFFSMANNAQNRAVFVNSVVEFLKAYEFFDGIDIDWEYPGGGGANGSLGSWQDRKGYADLMRDLRVALDGLSAQTGRTYELTSAVGSAPSKIDAVDYAQAQVHMDYIFAMTYDYYGAWSGVLGHHSALFDYSENTNEGFYGAGTIANLIQAGVPSEKLVLGVAKYGRGWKGVTGYQAGQPLTGTGGGASKGTWEAGVLDYKDIVNNYLGGTSGTGINGYRYYYDEAAEAPYLWNESNGTFITYENPRSVKAKGAYVLRHNLGGLFSWEVDADNGDIMNAMSESLSAQ